MPKREPGPNPIPDGYDVTPGDRWVRVTDLRRKHQGRIFEARGVDGAGLRGALTDVAWHMLHSVVFLHFQGVQQPFRSGVDGWLLMKPEDWVEPTVVDE